jgi:hypothetical protein
MVSGSRSAKETLLKDLLIFKQNFKIFFRIIQNVSNHLGIEDAIHSMIARNAHF